MRNNKFLSISILIPTLNADSVLGNCLDSIDKQEYPREKIEVIIADGGSGDQTLKIAKKYKAKIYFNKLKTGEAGKAVALKHAKNELVALIDSDNRLPANDWLKKVTEPFSDSEVIGSEPWEFTYEVNGGFIDRYCALMGVNDPLCFFLGNYDRQNLLSNKWTGLKLEAEDEGGWIKLFLKPPKIPTIGANGTILRRKIFSSSSVDVKDYFFDIDIMAKMASEKPIIFAKVKTGIIHHYCCSDVKKFSRKQKRRIRDYLYYQASGVRSYPWGEQNRLGLLYFVFCCFTVLPLLFQAIFGFLKKRDPAWFFHPLACWITLWVYSTERISALMAIKKMERKNWRQ